jgi:hypothetical protein
MPVWGMGYGSIVVLFVTAMCVEYLFFDSQRK